MRSCSFSEAGVVVTVVRFGLVAGAGGCTAAVWKRPMSPQADSVAAAHSRTGTAQSWRLIPILRMIFFGTPVFTLRYAALRVRIIPLVAAQHFDLPAPYHLDPRAGVRLDPAANQNPPIL